MDGKQADAGAYAFIGRFAFDFFKNSILQLNNEVGVPAIFQAFQPFYS